MKKNDINLPAFSKVLRGISLTQLKKVNKNFKKSLKDLKKKHDNNPICIAIIMLMNKMVEKEITRQTKKGKVCDKKI